MSNYHRENVPPPSGPELVVRRLKAAEKLTLTVLSSFLNGFWVHWDNEKNHSLPCLKPKDECEGCDLELPRRWKGFVHCFNHNNRKQEFLELTPAPAKQLLDELPAGESIRGLRICCERGAGQKARVRVTVLSQLATAQELPQEIDPIPTLEKLWKLSGVKLRVYDAQDTRDFGT